MATWKRPGGSLIEVREESAQEQFAINQGWEKQEDKPKRTRKSKAGAANERDSQHSNS